MKTAYPSVLPRPLVEEAVRNALLEDLGRAGDITSHATIAPEKQATAILTSREDGVLAGLDFVRAAFAQIDSSLEVSVAVTDATRIKAGQEIVRISGNARSILSAERVALNYLMVLSGIATYTARFADKIAHTQAKICDTRKTMPGMRSFAKYAVRCGGGANHRFGLDDAVLIKDNHIAVAGGVKQAIEAARSFVGHLVKIEVEVDTLEQMAEALSVQADVILLDNMPPETLVKAVEINAGRAKLEASGNINFDTLKAVAETGVDYISTSKITMSAPTLDVGLDIIIT
ncbi:carboxylating nicotinate-nucleotide diphosphorylase [Pseudochrobactrum algeriensis]|uniref:carboxylating nicotinate-nucleotide diphosphorylase n=1 Tax=Pseudochrobactrum algeriensis TaxID=2834768 RepID=UPI001BCBCB9C|nr:carboxylating nicotinate-nucleotide diphosphorylase [Pseudochrobactrum algeriensis]MBX8813490.1 carboxylating nicotinate-nucleotide diphosphorylase [Ochrobactrum sp. MR34]QVQ37661.1 carboxylating nicotinate-nucleotide diphosphorylase [Pseudochrobactrum algeriensis]QVQ40881.1 carboxylating nicotinate-nucleotide diphosphorylase [Pseudochrobactrum algeriensis]QVQ44805.1 carboxylating nicotinate-nucleotide diphosphorylase [Pseudochrobactrum algeriensis]